jgi:hypothetical protein
MRAKLSESSEQSKQGTLATAADERRAGGLAGTDWSSYALGGSHVCLIRVPPARRWGSTEDKSGAALAWVLVLPAIAIPDGGQSPGQGHRAEDTMSHDKIKAAARRRMAETGEPYGTARRAVIREHQQAAPGDLAPGSRWFAISYSDAWEGRLAGWLDARLFRAGPGVSGAEVGAGEIRIRMGSYKLDIPRTSVRSVKRSQARVGRTTGVHTRRGRWLVNGSAEGLVEITLSPPCYPARSIDTLFGVGPSRVDSLVMSLEDPDGFIAAVTATPASPAGSR